MSFLIGCRQEAKATHTLSTQDSLQVKNSSKEAISTLKEFYFSMYGNDADNEDLKKKYVSERVLKRIESLTSNPENLILDYDPFIKGQDYDANIIRKTLEIKPLNKRNEYRASFLLFGGTDEKRTNVDLLLKQNQEGDFLIDAILNDDHLNFVESGLTTKEDSNFDGYKLIQEIKTDINQDGKQDIISIYGTDWNKEIKPTDSKLFKVTVRLNDGSNFLTYTNSKIILPYFPDNVASGFSDIKVKNNYFTVEQANGQGNFIEKSFTTFKYDHSKNGIFLHKYSTITTDRNSGDEKEIKSEYSEKDFGKITFAEFNPDTIIKK
ncbi:DUF3828 domain-containing protein [Chryseobacterium sp. Leaf394]|uniref:DUF3828 domain-containing protein n=1 Tax=Chryseobacterium sp. Leaf394 TaxID=1736361 RepID=UPI0012FF0F00|nr:DUF3828 domain-containing protein [Chryseobacterium sp. Leaf394]